MTESSQFEQEGRSVALPRGLTVILGSASTGKSTLLGELATATGGLHILLDEPLEQRNAGALHLDSLDTLRDLVLESQGTRTDDGERPLSDELIREIAAPLCEGAPLMIDSLRAVMFGGDGALMRGGLSAGALLTLTRLHNLAYPRGPSIIATLNTVYEADGKDADLYRLMVEHVSGSVGTLLVRSPGGQATDSFFGRVGGGPQWSVHRSRDGDDLHLQELLERFNG